jgi:hypothetical protein
MPGVAFIVKVYSRFESKPRGKIKPLIVADSSLFLMYFKVANIKEQELTIRLIQWILVVTSSGK